MRIDFHTHFYPEKVAAKAIAFVEKLGLKSDSDGTRRGLEESMARSGIDLSVGMPVVTSPENSLSINRFAAANNNGNIRMFGSVHPDEADKLGTLQFIKDSGLYGVKVHPEYQGFDFGEERLFPVWEKCIELNLPVLTHAGADIAYTAPFHSDPERLAAFHRRYPELTFIIAHLGSYQMWDAVERELLGEDVYLDISLAVEDLPVERIESMIRRHGADRILLGSDSPWFSQRKPWETVEKMSLSSEEKAAILSGNAERLLALSRA